MTHYGYVGYRSMGHPEPDHDDDLVDKDRCRSCDIKLSDEQLSLGHEWCAECYDAEEERYE